jgi:2-polyprenyl-3-methyl-5-hydroxy-6-metoxy-1,4-benzoquinol methylase
MSQTTTGPKATSYAYGQRVQQKMLQKYRDRETNHWKERIACARRLFRDFALPYLKGKPSEDILIVDVGCSVGTFALEFAKDGYQTIGVDFDPAAIEIARTLAKEEDSKAIFHCMDLADWETNELPPIRVAVCFDIFEHLHDDEIGALLITLKRAVAPGGRMIFSTTPTQYSFLWTGTGLRSRITRFLVLAMRNRSRLVFEHWVKSLASLCDIVFLWRHGKTHDELIKRDKHCNLLTKDRVSDILNRNGWEVEYLESLNLHQSRFLHLEKLRNQPIAHSHIIGVAVPNLYS